MGDASCRAQRGRGIGKRRSLRAPCHSPIIARRGTSVSRAASTSRHGQIGVLSIDAKYLGTWELPAIGASRTPTAVLVRPDGYVAWVGGQTQLGLANALTTWFGPPAAR